MTGKSIKIQVSFHAESENMYAVAVNLQFDDSGKFIGSSGKEWFPKSLCVLEKIEPTNPNEELPKYFLTVPVWLLDKKKIKY